MSENHGRFAGRHAIVTGGASGIGRATAARLAGLGADVVIADIDVDGGTAVAEAIGATFVPFDVADPTAWADVVQRLGPFDVAFLNAGVSTYGGLPPAPGMSITQLTDAAYRRIMSVNLDGVVFGARAVIPGMIEAGRGDLIATASLAGLGPIAFDPIYGLTKHGVVGFIRSLAAGAEADPAATGICCSAICPGWADTSIIDPTLREMIDTLDMPVMPAEEVADAVVRVLDERIQGAQWVIHPGQQPYVYSWNPATG